MRVQLTDPTLNRFGRPVRGRGGFQNLLRTITGGIDRATGVLDISERDVERVIRYAAKYGDGGFQGRLGPLAAALATQR